MAVDRNKEKFLNDLREYLGILEEQEQEDILAEYAQHIDMKMQKGLSEEEAIRDFGSVQELAAEILAAYHVDSKHAMSVGRRGVWPAAFGKSGGGTGQPGSRRSLGNMRGVGWLKGHRRDRADVSEDGEPVAVAGQAEETEGRFFQRAGRWIREVVSGVVRGIRNGFCRIGKACRRFVDRCRKPFYRKREMGIDLQVERTAVDIRTEEKRKSVMGGFFGTMGRGTARLWKWFLGCCLFWMRLFWNMAWLLFSVLCAGMAMFALMGIGATVIFLFGGYPFRGILVLVLGGMLCFGALSAGAFGMMIRKKEQNGDSKEKRIDGEVHYEQTA